MTKLFLWEKLQIYLLCYFLYFLSYSSVVDLFNAVRVRQNFLNEKAVALGAAANKAQRHAALDELRAHKFGESRMKTTKQQSNGLKEEMEIKEEDEDDNFDDYEV